MTNSTLVLVIALVVLVIWNAGPVLARLVEKGQHRRLVTVVLLALFGFGLYSLGAAAAALDHIDGGEEAELWLAVASFTLPTALVLALAHLRTFSKNSHARA